MVSVLYEGIGDGVAASQALLLIATLSKSNELSQRIEARFQECRTGNELGVYGA